MDALRPDNFRVTIVSQNFPGDWDQTEQWYGTEYRHEKIPDDLLDEINAAAAAPASTRPKELHLPAVNEFVPNRLDVEKKEVKTPSLAPTLIRHDENVRTWFKKDDRFWVPKANIFVCLRTPLASPTPRMAVLTQLYGALVRDGLEEYAYDAELAGLDYSLSEHSSGLDISVAGYNDKMSVLLEKVLLSMRDLDVREDRFEIIKERVMRGYKNWDYSEPFRQIQTYLLWLVRDGGWITDELLAELHSVTAEDVRAFFPQLLGQMHIEILAHGNLYKEDALRVTTLVESTLRTNALPANQWPTIRQIVPPTGSNHVYRRALRNENNVNHCLEYSLLTGFNVDRAHRARVLLFEKMTEEPCFDTLRTKEQLGYVVMSSAIVFRTMIGWRILIQSERDCGHLEKRCDAFVAGFGDTLAAMSEDDFDAIKIGLINKRLEKLKNLGQESGRFWSHITGEVFDFELGELVFFFSFFFHICFFLGCLSTDNCRLFFLSV